MQFEFSVDEGTTWADATPATLLQIGLENLFRVFEGAHLDVEAVTVHGAIDFMYRRKESK